MTSAGRGALALHLRSDMSTATEEACVTVRIVTPPFLEVRFDRRTSAAGRPPSGPDVSILRRMENCQCSWQQRDPLTSCYARDVRELYVPCLDHPNGFFTERESSRFDTLGAFKGTWRLQSPMAAS